MIGGAVSLCAPIAGSTTTTSLGAKVLKLIKAGRGGDSLARRFAHAGCRPARQWVLLYGPYCVSWCGAADNFCLMAVVAEPLRDVRTQHVPDARVP